MKIFLISVDRYFNSAIYFKIQRMNLANSESIVAEFNSLADLAAEQSNDEFTFEGIQFNLDDKIREVKEVEINEVETEMVLN